MTHRIYAERLAACGTDSNPFETFERIDEQTGELTVRQVWRAHFDIPGDLIGGNTGSRWCSEHATFERA